MIIGATTVDKFKPLSKPEIDFFITQINDAFSKGTSPQESVSFPASVLAQLLNTIKHLEEYVPPEKTAEELGNIFDNLVAKAKSKTEE